MISGSVKGVQKLLKATDILFKNLDKQQKEALKLSVLAIHSEAVKLIQENSDGPSQTRYAPKRTVNASKPGDPPNTDTGRLVQSVKFEFSKGFQQGRVGSNLKYAAWLEFGTEKMGPRPWLSTAVGNTADDIKDIYEAAVAKGVKESTK